MPFILAMDYDGSLTEDTFPVPGAFKMDVVNKVKEFQKHGAEICLWTCREDKSLKEAVHRCKTEVGLEFDAINENAPSQKAYIEKQKSKGDIFALRKIHADFYADDKARNLDIFLKIDAKATCENFANR